MDLGTLINTLQNMGNNFASWYGIDTNIDSAELKCEDGKYSVELKVKEEQK